MKLKTYLQRQRLSPRKFAKIVGCTHQAVRHWIKDRRRPRLVWQEKIAVATAGAVKRSSFEVVRK